MQLDTYFQYKVAKAILNLPRFFVTCADILQQLELEPIPENFNLVYGYLCILQDDGYIERIFFRENQEEKIYFRLTAKGHGYANTKIHWMKKDEQAEDITGN